MPGRAQLFTFANLRSQERRPLATGADNADNDAWDPINKAADASKTCRLVALVLGVPVFLFALFAIPSLVPRPSYVLPSPSPPPPPFPPITPPSPPPRSPHVDIVPDGSPFNFSEVSGNKVTWAAAQANADGWPTGQAELLYQGALVRSEANATGPGYLFSFNSGGDYPPYTLTAMESNCRSYCSNQPSGNWQNASGAAIPDLCQFFVMVDQYSVSGVHKIRCVFFRGNGAHLQPVADSGLPSGSTGFVYSVWPFVE